MQPMTADEFERSAWNRKDELSNRILCALKEREELSRQQKKRQDRFEEAVLAVRKAVEKYYAIDDGG